MNGFGFAVSTATGLRFFLSEFQLYDKQQQNALQAKPPAQQRVPDHLEASHLTQSGRGHFWLTTLSYSHFSSQNSPRICIPSAAPTRCRDLELVTVTV